MKVCQPFGVKQKRRGTIGESTRPKTDIFSCNENGCVLTFKTNIDVQAHMDTGQHVRVLESETLYDVVRKRWAEKVTGISQPSRLHFSADEQPCSSNMEKQGPQPQEGWALKTVKKPTRMVEKAKDYLVQKFDAGTKTGLKADPVQVSREMKYVKDSSGQLLFKPDEWITAQQINSSSPDYRLFRTDRNS